MDAIMLLMFVGFVAVVFVITRMRGRQFVKRTDDGKPSGLTGDDAAMQNEIVQAHLRMNQLHQASIDTGCSTELHNPVQHHIHHDHTNDCGPAHHDSGGHDGGTIGSGITESRQE